MLVARIRARSRDAERRWNVRRDVDIATSARAEDGDGYAAYIRNLSENGLLIETKAPLGPRDTFEVSLPDYAECVAEVVWAKGDLKGCRFYAPIPKSVVSAAVLRSPVEGSSEQIYDELRHARLAIDDEEKRHMPETLSVPGLVFLLVAEIAILGLLFGMLG
ncbi:PilZ domain-containing protein [Croceicoccus bisphenolivorans]|uniref:PilZ domain-containing protein n=1 Tax=Croceicoccus bisphenolivorans TaxID=1783232 RepID=UPI0008305763|nr:PilZ domain-containing protein [Croceicoccus bisphenolivorans]